MAEQLHFTSVYDLTHMSAEETEALQRWVDQAEPPCGNWLYFARVVIAFSRGCLLTDVTPNEPEVFWLAHQQEFCLQQLKHCAGIMLWERVPHNASPYSCKPPANDNNPKV